MYIVRYIDCNNIRENYLYMIARKMHFVGLVVEQNDI